MAEATIQWYPGHIAKLERELDPLLKQLDVVIVVLDARIPEATTNPRIAAKIQDKLPVLLILNKADLADPQWTHAWIEHFKKQFPRVLAFDAVSGKQRLAIVQALTYLAEQKMLQLERKGLKRRPIRTGVVGMPNVGKSTIINALLGKKKVKTGHRAGVTRVTQWVKVHDQVILLDTPGLIPPKLDNPETAELLAAVYSIGDAAFQEEEVVPAMLNTIFKAYPEALCEHYSLDPDQPPSIEAIAQKRLFLLPGGELDLRRTAQAILKDFRLGRLGRMTLERP